MLNRPFKLKLPEIPAEELTPLVKELLRLLEARHANPSESDIREYVKKRKISSGTRSDDGKRCRDTFASRKKTCRKHGISFWEYLNDRVSGSYRLPPLGDVIRQAVASRLDSG